jgi:single-stranded DNA-binding protein
MMPPSPEGRDLINLVAGESVSNVCVISGWVSEYGPTLRYLESGNPELPMTILVDEVGRDGRTYPLFCPVVVYGHPCEALAEGLEGGDLVLVTGRLAWAKRSTKAGENAGLAVTCFNVETLVAGAFPAQVASAHRAWAGGRSA